MPMKHLDEKSQERVIDAIASGYTPRHDHEGYAKPIKRTDKDLSAKLGQEDLTISQKWELVQNYLLEDSDAVDYWFRRGVLELIHTEYLAHAENDLAKNSEGGRGNPQGALEYLIPNGKALVMRDWRRYAEALLECYKQLSQHKEAYFHACYQYTINCWYYESTVDNPRYEYFRKAIADTAAALVTSDAGILSLKQCTTNTDDEIKTLSRHLMIDRLRDLTQDPEKFKSLLNLVAQKKSSADRSKHLIKILNGGASLDSKKKAILGYMLTLQRFDRNSNQIIKPLKHAILLNEDRSLFKLIVSAILTPADKLKIELAKYKHARENQFFNFTLFTPKNRQKAAKIAAADALMAVMDGKNGPESLGSHMPALTDGRLKKLYDKYRKLQGDTNTVSVNTAPSSRG